MFLLRLGVGAASRRGGGGCCRRVGRTEKAGWLAGWMDHDLMKGGGGDAGTSLFAFPLRDPRGSCTIYYPASSWWSLGRERVAITMTGWRRRTTARGGGKGEGGAPRCRRTRKPLVRCMALHSIARHGRSGGTWESGFCTRIYRTREDGARDGMACRCARGQVGLQMSSIDRRVPNGA